MEKIKEQCSNCKFWEFFGLTDENAPDGDTEGFCRRYAPRIVNGQLFQAPDIAGEVDSTKQEFPDCWDNLTAIQPKTQAESWCGEWKGKG